MEKVKIIKQINDDSIRSAAILDLILSDLGYLAKMDATKSNHVLITQIREDQN